MTPRNFLTIPINRESELRPAGGLIYYRARYYDPTIGRFISEDPIGFSSGDTNFYRYVGNNPINRIDPTGNSQQDVTRIINTSGKSVQDMVDLGLRFHGRNPNKNNILSTLMWLNNGATMSYRIPYLGCGQQTDWVIQDLTPLLLKTDDLWELNKVEGFEKGLWHQYLRATSKNKTDPDIVVDPLHGTYQLLPKGAKKTNSEIPLPGLK